MFRAFFLAVGIFLCMVGAETLFIERAVLAQRNAPASTGMFGQEVARPRREIVPPPWAPWSLLGAGAIVMIYSFTIPRRVKG